MTNEKEKKMTETYGWVSCETPPEKAGLYPVVHSGNRLFMEWTGSEWSKYGDEENPTYYQPRPLDPKPCFIWSPESTPVGSVVTYQEIQSCYDIGVPNKVVVVDWSNGRACVRIGDGAWVPLSQGQRARRRIVSIELPSKAVTAIATNGDTIFGATVRKLLKKIKAKLGERVEISVRKLKP
jgi:hypothetical protein